jgi:hypothetical protein
MASPPDAVVCYFYALMTAHIEAETKAVVFTSEASKRDGVVELPTVNLSAVHRQRWTPIAYSVRNS